MCILCVASRWSRRIVTMLPCLVIPLIILWALSQVLPPGFRFEVTSPRLACVFVLLISLGWYEVVMPRLSAWRARRSALLRDRRRVQAQEAAKWRKEATRRCRNCSTAYRDQSPAGGRFMCTYCGHVSRRPVLDIPGVTSGIPSNGVHLQGGITQIGIPVSGVYGRKNVRAWNGKGLPVRAGWSTGKLRMGDRSWASEWSGADSWLGGSWLGASNYWGSNGNMCGDIFGGGERCSASESYSGVVIFLLRIIGFFFLCIRWIWRRIFRRGSSGQDEALNAGRKAGSRKGEDGRNSQGNKGEKARRKAEEKRQARLEKERLEEEERKQREEVARLVEERRRLRVEKLKAEKDSEREAAAEREREIRREREAERRRQDKIKEKDKGLSRDKTQPDIEEVKKKGKENEKKGETDKKGENEKKGETDKKGENEKREVLKTTARHATEVKRSARNFRVFSVETGLKNNDHLIKVGNNGTSKVCGSRYLGPIKGSFQSHPKSSAWHPCNAPSFLGKGFGTDSNLGVKSSKSASSGGAFLLSMSNSLAGSNNLKSAQSTGSEWNRMAWTKAWGKGSNINPKDVLSRETSSTNINGDRNSGGFEAEKTVVNGADKSSETENLQPPVGSELQPLSPATTHTGSWEQHLTSPSTSSLTACSADLGSPLEQQCQTEVESKSEAPTCSSPSLICFASSPWREPMSIVSNSVTVSDSPPKSMNSHDSISSCNMLPDNLVLSEVDSFEDLLNLPNPASFLGPVSKLPGILSSDLENRVSSDEGATGILSSGCEPILAPVHKPEPIESPISKLLPSGIVDEVRVGGEQLHPITEPWGLRSLSLDGPNDVSEQGKWEMWGTPQLVQTKLASPGEASSWILPFDNGFLEQEKGMLQPLSQRNGQSPFEPERRLPSCLFTPQNDPNSSNQSNVDIIGMAAPSNTNSLWVNQPAFESTGGSWDNLNHHRVPPNFVNCGTQGDMQFSVITTDSHLYERSPTVIWLKTGMENSKDKSNWCAETELGSSWSTTINTPARPHIGGIYITPDVQAVWSYK